MHMARVLLSAGAMLTANAAAADVWTLTGRARAGAEYDNNVRLSYTDEIATTELSAEAGATLARQGDAFSLSLEPRASSVHYVDYSELNHTDASLALRARRGSERGRFDLALTGLQDSTLTSELGSTGYTQVNKYHRSGTFTLSPSWQWTERLVAVGQFYGTVHRYVDAEFTGLVDYDYGMAASSLSYGWNERSTLAMQLSAGRLRVPDESGYDKTTYAATLTYTRQLDEHWQTVLSWGPSEIRSRTGTNRGSVYELSATRQSELFNTRAALKREVTPTGQGTLTRRDEASLGFYRALSERLSVNINGIWVRNRNVLSSGGLEVNALRYAAASAGAHWKLTPTWSVSTNIGYAQQRYSTADDTARRGQISFSVNWSGLTRTL